MNRRRPWPQRLIRRVTRHAALRGLVASSPLSILFGVNAIGSLVALASGAYAVAAVLAGSSVASWVCQFRCYHTPLT